MNKVFCPYLSDICTDGYPGDFPCVLYDEENQVCLIRENMRHTAEQLRFQAKMRAKFQVLGQDKDPLNKLLKDVDL